MVDLNEEILVRLEAIVGFLKRHERLWRAHVVEFFQERQWELLRADWIAALENASLQELLLLPSHVSQERWPDTLKEFLRDASSLSLPRAVCDSELLSGKNVSSLPKIMAVGVNAKKLHEIERLSTLIVNVSRAVDATEVIDVGAGQGYLAQVLSFQHGLPVVALDCSQHNIKVANQRAERIRRYYEARSHPDEKKCGPRSITCRIGSNEDENNLNSFLSSAESLTKANLQCSVLLAGLHACGDLSANMLRTFVQCQQVSAVVSVGCCYNLLSEGTDSSELYGFPLSKGVAAFGLHLGGAGRDLGCQSADRWKDVGENAALNFEIHAYRAALQIALQRFYPHIAATSPSVGRLGKAKRRKQCLKSPLSDERCSRQGATFAAFQDYTAAALERLQLPAIARESLIDIWEEMEPFLKYVGPFWSLRSAIAPVLETLLLLDRLLYLKESEREKGGGITSKLVPVFDARISPRNMAVIALKSK